MEMLKKPKAASWTKLFSLPEYFIKPNPTMFNPTKLTLLLCVLVSLSSCATQNMNKAGTRTCRQDDSLFF